MPTHNPCGLDGFAFLEFSGENPGHFHTLFQTMGFHKTSTHKTRPITQYQQGNIQFIVNAQPQTQAHGHALTHGPGVCAMGFRVHDADKAMNYVLQQGASAFEDTNSAHHGLPAISAIGGSVIYFVDASHTPFQNQWDIHPPIAEPTPGLLSIDHLTHNVFRGNMQPWVDFYEKLFNFKEIRFFNIQGKMTGLLSRALASPCGKIKIPLNESLDDKSQIEEFLHDYQGEGIQHVALSTETIYDTVHCLREKGMVFLDVPDTYYEGIADRLCWHKEPLSTLQQEKILIDGDPTPDNGLLLQIFTHNLFGPVFFEIIQRKGNEGFGEGNFQALFEAIERDQIKRGTLTEENLS